MPKHKTEDYKLSAVKYYLKNDFSMEYVCDIFECKKQSLSRWVDRYLLENSIKRHNRLPVSYKITKQQVKYAIQKVKKNEQITMTELVKFYENYIFRKLKLNSYMNRLKSEQQLINRFKKIFGNTKDTIVCIGDWEQRKHRKFKEPTKDIGFRNMFRKNGFQVYLVDEFRTLASVLIVKVANVPNLGK